MDTNSHEYVSDISVFIISCYFGLEKIQTKPYMVVIINSNNKLNDIPFILLAYT